MLDAQLSHFENIKTFRFWAHLVHLIIKQNIPYFDGYGLQNKDAEGNIFPTIEWLPMIRKKSNGEVIVDYINNIMGTIYFLIKGDSPPRVIMEMRTLMHLTTEVAIGDWFLFETYIVLKIYGFNGDPYMLPMFMTPRIFSL